MRPPSGDAPAVTVSIVSHGQWRLIAPLLQQLGEFCAAHVEQVVLTLNLHEDVDFAGLALAERIRLVRNLAPKGFGDNHNRAFAHCATPWFLVLNPDIRLNRDVLAPLLSRARPGAGLLAPRVLEPHAAAPEPYRGLLTPWELVRRRWRSHTPPLMPTWVPGMFMLLQRQAFADLNGFDKRFYMYCEDHDLCIRLQLAGWCLQVEADLVVLHDARRDSHASVRALRWHLASLFKMWCSAAFWRFLLRPAVPTAAGA